MQTEVQKLFEFFKILENLSIEKRIIKLKNHQFESTAEHSFSMAMMIMALKPYIERKFDYTKTLEMALVHDLGEAVTGDIASHKQTKEVKKNKFYQEEKAILDITALLNESAKETFQKLWYEYETRETNEAKLIKLLDIFDAHIKILNHHSLNYIKQFDGGDFYFNSYANFAPNKDLKIDGEIFDLMETIIRQNLINKMDNENISYTIVK